MKVYNEQLQREEEIIRIKRGDAYNAIREEVSTAQEAEVKEGMLIFHGEVVVSRKPFGQPRVYKRFILDEYDPETATPDVVYETKELDHMFGIHPHCELWIHKPTNDYYARLQGEPCRKVSGIAAYNIAQAYCERNGMDVYKDADFLKGMLMNEGPFYDPNAFEARFGAGPFATRELAAAYQKAYKRQAGNNIVILGPNQNDDGTWSPAFNVWN